MNTGPCRKTEKTTCLYLFCPCLRPPHPVSSQAAARVYTPSSTHTRILPDFLQCRLTSEALPIVLESSTQVNMCSARSGGKQCSTFEKGHNRRIDIQQSVGGRARSSRHWEIQTVVLSAATLWACTASHLLVDSAWCQVGQPRCII